MRCTHERPSRSFCSWKPDEKWRDERNASSHLIIRSLFSHSMSCKIVINSNSMTSFFWTELSSKKLESLLVTRSSCSSSINVATNRFRKSLVSLYLSASENDWWTPTCRERQQFQSSPWMGGCSFRMNQEPRQRFIPSTTITVLPTGWI